MISFAFGFANQTTVCVLEEGAALGFSSGIAKCCRQGTPNAKNQGNLSEGRSAGGPEDSVGSLQKETGEAIASQFAANRLTEISVCTWAAFGIT